MQQISPLALTFDLDHNFHNWFPVIVPLYTYILNFNLLGQILSDVSIFDDAFRLWSTYRPVEQKSEVVHKIWCNPIRRRAPTAHFGLYLVSLRQILKILCFCKISSIYVTYMTFDLALWPWLEISLWKNNQWPI